MTEAEAFISYLRRRKFMSFVSLRSPACRAGSANTPNSKFLVCGCCSSGDRRCPVHEGLLEKSCFLAQIAQLHPWVSVEDPGRYPRHSPSTLPCTPVLSSLIKPSHYPQNKESKSFLAMPSTSPMGLHRAGSEYRKQ